MRIGFIGLGNMGLPIANNLGLAGFTLQAYNRSVEKRRSLHGERIILVDRAEEAAGQADVVITMLSDDAAVTEVQSIILPHMTKGSIHLSMSTIAPATAMALAEKCADHGVIYLASPVLGRPPAAAAKQLFILLSGNPEAKNKVQPLLQAVSQRTFDYGEIPGTANTVKLLMNYMIFIVIEMMSEVVLTAERSNIDKNSFFDMMMSTIFGAPVIKNYGSLVVQERDNPGGFATRLASKDLRLMQETAASHHMTLPLAEVIQSHFKEMISASKGDQDVGLLISHLREKLTTK